MEMMEQDLGFDSDFVGRDEELDELFEIYSDVLDENGSTIFISGEAGIGKTKLVEEFLDEISAENHLVIQGYCMSGGLKPLFPLKKALKNAELYHLIAEEPPPKVISAYLMDSSGLLISKAERAEMDLDSDIFASMLTAVENFVKDSLSYLGEDEKSALNSITYGDYNILIQARGDVSLAAVIKGKNSEFLIEDMKKRLSVIEKELGTWGGNEKEANKVEHLVRWFTESGKYDGGYLVDDPKLRQENLFDNILLGLQRLSKEKPVIFFIDDMQWIDPTSISLIHYLARNTVNNKVMIIGTYRPEDLVNKTEGESHVLKSTIQDMSRENIIQRMEIGRMDKSSIKSMVQSILDGNIEENLIGKIYSETEGNPFFSVEMLKLLLIENILERENRGWSFIKTDDEIKLPSKIYDVITRRLNRLNKQQYEVLESASIIGNRFRSEILNKVVMMNRINLLKILNRIENDHQLIHSSQEGYFFDHKTIREVLYNDINSELKVEYHRLVADSYEEIYEDNISEVLLELAHHYLKARDKKAGNYLMKAGRKTKEDYANDESIEFFEDAIQFLEDEGDLYETYESLGELYSIKAEFEKAVDYYHESLEYVSSHEEEAYVMAKIAKAYDKMGRYEDGLEKLEEGLSLLRGRECKEKVALLNASGWTKIKIGRSEEAGEDFQRALEMAERIGNKNRIANTKHSFGSFYILKGDYDKAKTHLKKAQRIRKEIGDIRAESGTLNNMGVIYGNLGNLEKANKCYKKSMENFEKIGDKVNLATSLNNLGTNLDDMGLLEESLKYHFRALDMKKKVGDTYGIATAYNNIGNVYRDMGDMEKSLEYQNKSLGLRKELGDSEGIGMSYLNIALVHKLRKEYGKALELHKKSMQIGEDVDFKRLYVENQFNIAEIRVEEGELDEALELARDALKNSIELGTKIQEAETRMVLGMVYTEKNSLEEAEDQFMKAKDIFEGKGERKALARLYYHYSRFLKNKKSTKEAEEMLNKAEDMFIDMGMKLWVMRCKELSSIEFI